MEVSIRLPDGLASRVNAFAAEHDIPVDRAYELLVSVGVEALDDVDVDVYVEDGRLILECPECGSTFGSPGRATAHDCE